MRASPSTDPVALPDRAHPQPKPVPETEKFLLRMPRRIKRICMEAAETEGLSLNVWATRVLAESAKRSQRDGWRSIPVADLPSVPPPAAVPETPSPHTQPPPYQPYIQPTVYTPQWPPRTGTGAYTNPGSGTIVNPGSGTFSASDPTVSISGIDISSQVTSFTIPDSDIPEF